MDDTPETLVNRIVRRWYGRWVSIPHPASPTGFFASSLHGLFVPRFASHPGGAVEVEVLAGTWKGTHFADPEDVGGSHAEKALLSYAPMTEVEALALVEQLQPEEAELLGRLMDEGGMARAAPPGLRSPAAQAMLLGFSAVLLSQFFVKK